MLNSKISILEFNLFNVDPPQIHIFVPEGNLEILLLGLELLIKFRTSSILIQNGLKKDPVYRKVVDTEMHTRFHLA